VSENACKLSLFCVFRSKIFQIAIHKDDGMKIGIFTALFHDRPFEEALDYIAAAGIESVELGGGAYPGSRHLDDFGGIVTLAKDSAKRKKARRCDSIARSDPLGGQCPREPAAPEQRDSNRAPQRF
jgi:sugar phosphate isomerase/epimerase